MDSHERPFPVRQPLESPKIMPHIPREIAELIVAYLPKKGLKRARLGTYPQLVDIYMGRTDAEPVESVRNMVFYGFQTSV